MADKDGVTVYYTGAKAHSAEYVPGHAPWEPDALIKQVQQDALLSRHAVCVVQNISAKWTAALGGAWAVEPSFFDEHTQNPDRSTLWYVRNTWKLQPSSGPASAQPQATQRKSRVTNHKGAVMYAEKCWHIDGILEHHYAMTLSPGHVSAFVDHLILVDAADPFEGAANAISLHDGVSRRPTTLRVMYANNYGGLLLPRLISKSSYSLMDTFQMFLQHQWHFDFLFGKLPVNGGFTAIQPHPLLYLLASSISQANLTYLEERINDLSFVKIREPEVQTNDQLHDMREHLSRLKAGVTQTVTWAPPDLDEYFESEGSRLDHLSLATPPPVGRLREVLREAKELEGFLMETFQLLMNSLSVKDSQISIQQSRRGTLLAVLAFIYIPLSFVTGIFGMNLKEINGSPLSVRVCFITFAVVIGSTALGYAVYRYLRYGHYPRHMRAFWTERRRNHQKDEDHMV
ncbi:hypothetical protein LTR85_005888 [Meristemomyces frigidus]|nr:hypothetical protein LTR85_005888 [Meristemomyces frigidus]